MGKIGFVRMCHFPWEDRGQVYTQQPILLKLDCGLFDQRIG